MLYFTFKVLNSNENIIKHYLSPLIIFLSNRPSLIEELTWFRKDDFPPLLGISKHMLWQEKLSDDLTDLV